MDKTIKNRYFSKPCKIVKSKLKDPGILLAPVGDQYSQELIKIKKKDLQIKKESLGYFQFVPLKGKYGFK